MVELYTIICEPQNSSSLTAVLPKLLAQEKLCDVTLLCSGGNIKAHQIILSAGSSYFEDMFVQNPDPHPIVHLPNVEVNEMRKMVKFIYHGKITLPMNDLPDFILKAQSFQVRRLLGVKYVHIVKSSEYIMGNLSGDEDTVQISINVVTQRYGNNTEVDGQLEDSMDDQENCYIGVEDVQQQQVDQSGEIPSTPEEGTNFATEEMESNVETMRQGGAIQLPDEPVTTNSTVLPPNFVVGRNETSVSNPSSSRTFERPVPSEQQIRIQLMGYRRASHTVSVTHSRCKICNELVKLTNRHYITHFPSFFICTLCPAIYKKRATLATHYKLKHPELTSERM
uniref:Uncharacterized protein n=1 Tax=Anopheles arabiensis TaxID=7173 RepID=A0A182HM75_ANOAR